MHALIIRQPWIGLILSGKKTWEMRSSTTQIRGRIGLIRRGTGLVVAVADLVESLPRLDPAQLTATRQHHQIPADYEAEAIGQGWLHPWVLTNIRALPRPVSGGQKPGQVIWVPLSTTTEAEIASQIGAAPAHTPGIRPADAGVTTCSVPAPTRAAAVKPAPAAADEITVELTDGAIRNANLSVRKALHLLPDTVVGGSNRDLEASHRLTVVFDPGETVETDIPSDKLTLRCRGAVADFFARTGVRGGDAVGMRFDARGGLRIRAISR